VILLLHWGESKAVVCLLDDPKTMGVDIDVFLGIAVNVTYYYIVSQFVYKMLFIEKPYVPKIITHIS
jgi:hypothetical protein